MRPLTSTLTIIGAFQLILGLAFLAAPELVARQLGFAPAAPAWANWLLAMMAARFLGYAYGMFWSARHPRRADAWIDTMIVIQAIDWLATLAYLRTGDVTLRQVSTASFMPVLFIGALLWFHPRRRAGHAVDQPDGRALVGAAGPSSGEATTGTILGGSGRGTTPPEVDRSHHASTVARESTGQKQEDPLRGGGLR